MRIGIYLGYAPYVRPMSLKQEGLGRYLSFLLKGFTNTGNTLIIACPNWVNPLLDELFDEGDIDIKNIEILNPSTEPVLFRLYFKWANRKQIKRMKRNRIKKVVLNYSDWFMDILICTKNIVFFIVLCIICSILAIALLPFIFLGVIVYTFIRFFIILFNKVFRKSKDNIKKAISKELMLQIRNRWSISNIQEKIRKDSAAEIVRKVRHMKNYPDVWYSPTAFWEEFNSFPGVRVICAPDLVTTEFPSKFSKGSFIEATKKIRNTIESGTYFITYCNYIKNELLLQKFYKGNDDVVVIPHAQNDMLPFLNLEDYFKSVPFKEDINLYFAKNRIIPKALINTVNMKNYLMEYNNSNNFSFNDVDYLFYPSQVRASKNILNLIKAYEYILRNRNIPIKLILTCNISADAELEKFIYDRQLQYDVLSFNNLTSQQLAAFYMCAKLVVNPTLYEGGFPFTFGEGISVGTPSVMSNIPQVMEEMQESYLSEYLFDPYNYLDMANKIEKGIRNRDDLLIKQRKLYNKLSKRTWEDVCKEHIIVFQHFIDRSKNKNEVQRNI